MLAVLTRSVSLSCAQVGWRALTEEAPKVGAQRLGALALGKKQKKQMYIYIYICIHGDISPSGLFFVGL